MNDSKSSRSHQNYRSISQSNTFFSFSTLPLMTGVVMILIMSTFVAI